MVFQDVDFINTLKKMDSTNPTLRNLGRLVPTRQETEDVTNVE